MKLISQGCQLSRIWQGVCLTVARSPVASAYHLGLVERPSPLARRASVRVIMISDFYNDGYSRIMFTN